MLSNEKRPEEKILTPTKAREVATRRENVKPLFDLRVEYDSRLLQLPACCGNFVPKTQFQRNLN